jgi:hypothetical protein
MEGDLGRIDRRPSLRRIKAERSALASGAAPTATAGSLGMRGAPPKRRTGRRGHEGRGAPAARGATAGAGRAAPKALAARPDAGGGGGGGAGGGGLSNGPGFESPGTRRGSPAPSRRSTSRGRPLVGATGRSSSAEEAAEWPSGPSGAPIALVRSNYSSAPPRSARRRSTWSRASSFLGPRSESSGRSRFSGDRIPCGERWSIWAPGTGAIAIALLHALPQWTGRGGRPPRPRAPRPGGRNAARNGWSRGASISSRPIGGYPDDAAAIGNEGSVDLVVSQPSPTFRTADIPGLMPEVRDHDPIEALDGGPDGPRILSGTGASEFRFGSARRAFSRLRSGPTRR